MHMCKLVGDRLGRAALTRSMLDGPSAFARLYNRIAPEGRRVLVDAPAS